MQARLARAAAAATVAGATRASAIGKTCLRPPRSAASGLGWPTRRSRRARRWRGAVRLQAEPSTLLQSRVPPALCDYTACPARATAIRAGGRVTARACCRPRCSSRRLMPSRATAAGGPFGRAATRSHGCSRGARRSLGGGCGFSLRRSAPTVRRAALISSASARARTCCLCGLGWLSSRAASATSAWRGGYWIGASPELPPRPRRCRCVGRSSGLHMSRSCCCTPRGTCVARATRSGSRPAPLSEWVRVIKRAAASA